MTTGAHLWAIGYDDMTRAGQVREELIQLADGLGRAGKYFILLDAVVVVRHPDGSYTFDRKPSPAVANVLAVTAVGFLTGLVVAAPLTGAAVGALLGGSGSAMAASAVGIADSFLREVAAMMKPGTSALFVLDDEGDLDMILHTIRGLGGVVLKTNVDLERVRLIQSTLASPTEGVPAKK
jgi:uncharacterized membrane protein